MRIYTSLLLMLGVFLTTGSIHAQATVVAPNVYTSVLAPGGAGLNTFIRDLAAPRTGQLLINANQLGTMQIGDQITGIAFRMFVGNTTGFPAVTTTWTNYTINVGVGVAFGSQSLTFASNFIGAPTQVRTGPYVLPAASYIGNSNPNPNPFGPFITFSTPYIYTGGNLLIEIRHPGSNVVNPANSFLEAVLQTDAEFNTNVWSATATGEAATLGAQNTFTIAQLQFSAVPEPTTWALIGISITGLAGVMYRRRKLNELALQKKLRR